MDENANLLVLVINYRNVTNAAPPLDALGNEQQALSSWMKVYFVM